MATVIIATDDNDTTVAEAYKLYIESTMLRAHGLLSGAPLDEDAAYANLDDYIDADFYSEVQPTLGSVESLIVDTDRITSSIPIRGWLIKNHDDAVKSLEGLVIVDETAGRILWLVSFNTAVSVAAGANAAVDVDLWFDRDRT